MKILYLTDQVFLHGGIEKVLTQKANYFADISGEEVFIVTYNQQNKKPVYPFSEKITFIDLHIDYEIGKSYFHPENLKKVPRHINALKKIFKKLNPNVVISSSFGPDFYFLPFIEKQIPKIKEFHASRFFYNHLNSHSTKAYLFKTINQFTEKNYNVIAVLNDDERHFYTNKNTVVIPNPAVSSEKRADFKSKKIMAAGRISPVKNFADLIEIFSLVANDFPDWEMHFWGEDYVGTQEKLEEKVKEKGLEAQIKFKGSSSDLKKEMQNYSIYAMTSETECFPMVLLESLSVGLPVISYDAPTGPKHILTNFEDSFLIPYKNLDIFTAKLKLLMSNTELRKEMGRKGIENVQRFNIDKVMLRWTKLFKSLQ